MKVTKRGFTLVEVMIYIALFGVLVGGAVVSAYQVLAGGSRNQQAVEIQQEGTFVNRKINWEVAQANSAQVVGNKLVLEPGHVVFEEISGRLMITRGAGGTSYPLNSGALLLSTTTFSVVPGSSGGPTSVRADFFIKSVPFTFARYLRD